MNKKSIAIVILVLIVILYAVATILGTMGLGTISVYTDKKEYKPGEKITISSKNSGITLLCGVPYWYVYNDNGTLVYFAEVRGPQCRWQQGYFGVEGVPLVWNPSSNYYSTLNNIEPQKEGTYKIVAMVRMGGGGFNISANKIITIK